MSKLKQFSGFVNENQNIDRLRELGMAPKAPVDERWREFIDEWGGDPEIQQAVHALKTKTQALMDTYFDAEDYDSQEWEQFIGWLWELSTEDLGLVEYLVSTDSL